MTGTGAYCHTQGYPAPSYPVDRSEATAGSTFEGQPPKSLSGNTSLGSESTAFTSAISGGDHPKSPAINYASATSSHSNEQQQQRARVQEVRDPEQHRQYSGVWRGGLRLRSPARAANSPVNDQGVRVSRVSARCLPRQPPEPSSMRSADLLKIWFIQYSNIRMNVQTNINWV